MDPAVLRGLRQPDQRTCAPTALVAARLLLDASASASASGSASADPGTFAASVLALHRSLTSRSYAGRAQLPWPRALGTPPSAVARAISELTGVPYQVRVIRWRGFGPALAAAQAAVADGLPCPVFVGSRWLPRHVVLAVGTDTDGPGKVQVYNPARGTIEALHAGRWRRTWFALLPRGSQLPG